jgi:hypothetical protein
MPDSLFGRIFCAKPVSTPDQVRGRLFPEKAFNTPCAMRFRVQSCTIGMKLLRAANASSRRFAFGPSLGRRLNSNR